MLNALRIVVRGAGDLATGVALRLYRSGFTRLVMLEREAPLAVRRVVCFSEAVRLGTHRVEGVSAVRVDGPEAAAAAQKAGQVPVLVDPGLAFLKALAPDVFIDAAMAKRNLGTSLSLAPLVIGIGPGFTAGLDCHRVVETCRGHALGRVLASGPAQADTGIPGAVLGHTVQRVVRAPRPGVFRTGLDIGRSVSAGQQVGQVDGEPVMTAIGGVLRGLLPDGTPVAAGMKIGDVDPRNDSSLCGLVSDKALAIGGGVLEAIMERFNTGRTQDRAQEDPSWPSATQ